MTYAEGCVLHQLVEVETRHLTPLQLIEGTILYEY